MSEFSLTITIPTFNRNAVLLETVKALLPQLSEQVRLVIHDNHSAVPVEKTLAPFIDTQENGRWVSVIRNAVNIGGNANVLRGLERAEGEWVWIVCDDDEPDPHAVDIIRDTIARNPAVSFINFYSPDVAHPVRTETKISTGLDQFLDTMDRFGSFMFAPACVFKTEAVKSRMILGYYSIHTYATHFAILLDMLQAGHTACQSHEIVVRFRQGHPEATWSWLEYTLGAPALVELVREPRLRRQLLRAITADFPLRAIYRPALLIARDQTPSSYGRFLFLQTMRRTYFKTWFRPGSTLQAIAMAESLRFPRATLAIIVFFWKLFKGRPSWVERQSKSRF